MTPSTRPVPAAGPSSRASEVAGLCAEVARSRQTLQVRVRGDCMEPVLRDGELVTVDPGARLRPGDIVAVVGADERLRVHRLLGAVPRRGGTVWLTKADAARTIDSPSERRHLLGRVRVGSPADRGRATARFLGVVLRALGRRVMAPRRVWE